MLSKIKTLSIPIAIIFALLSSILPLSCYLLSLSLFGLPHIYCELSYINDRFSPRMSFGFKAAILVVLSLICLCSLTAIIMPVHYYFQTIASLALLLFIITYLFVPSMLCLALALIFAIAITFNPILVFFLMAFMHNLSPWAFLKERQASNHSILIFIIIPICVFSISLVTAMDYSFYDQTQISTYLSHYIPVPWQHINITKALFSAAVYLQLIHYDSTIRLLPAYMNNKLRLSWPVIALFTFALCAYMINFAASRSIYAVFAAFHAWLEVPVLLAMFTYHDKLISAVPAENLTTY